MERPILAVITARAAAPLFSSDTPGPQDALAYGMPSVAGATYQVSDTMTMSVQSMGSEAVQGAVVVVVGPTGVVEMEISGSGNQGGMTLDQNFNGSITGRYYWDAEAGLLHSAELMRDFQGETTMPGVPPIPVTMKGPQRIIREN